MINQNLSNSVDNKITLYFNDDVTEYSHPFIKSFCDLYRFLCSSIISNGDRYFSVPKDNKSYRLFFKDFFHLEAKSCSIEPYKSQVSFKSFERDFIYWFINYNCCVKEYNVVCRFLDYVDNRDFEGSCYEVLQEYSRLAGIGFCEVWTRYITFHGQLRCLYGLFCEFFDNVIDYREEVCPDEERF